jgi:hypothetical protein
MTRLPFVFLFGAVLTLALGCDNGATVRGRVTQNGQPLPTGEIMFHPSAQGAIPIGSVVNGEYELATGQSDQVEKGDYRVTIEAKAPPEEGLVVGPGGQMTEAVGKRLTPDVYANPATTPLKATVKAGRNALDFDLKSAP